MLSSRRVLLFFAMPVALLGYMSGVGAAGETIDRLRADIHELHRSVHQPAAAPTGVDQAAGRRIVDRMFDWPAMAEAALRDSWRHRTPTERAEFTRLFSDLFARAYLSRIHLVDATTFQSVGLTTVGDRMSVRATVFTRRGSAIDVDYILRATRPARWRVQDIRVESISLVDSYRAQFETFIARSSYEGLVQRLRAIAQ